MLTGTDNAGNALSVTTIVKYDTVGPVSGALTVNAVASSAIGTSSYNKTGGYAISVRTDFTDPASGIASSDLTEAFATLSGNVCGTFGAGAVILGNPAQSGQTTGCWKYVLTGTDNSGNVTTTTTTVKVDLASPTGGALTINGVAADAGGTTVSYAKAAFPIDLRTDWVDAESGLSTSTLTRAVASLTGGGTCGTFGTTTTIVGTPSQTGLTTNCYRYVLTGTDNAGNAVSVTTIVKYDTVVPVSGALTVNAVASSAGAGSVSFNKTGGYAISVRTDYTDAASGIASSVLTESFATLSGNVCGTYGAATVITGDARAVRQDGGVLVVHADRHRQRREQRHDDDHGEGRLRSADWRRGHDQRRGRERGRDRQRPAEFSTTLAIDSRTDYTDGETAMVTSMWSRSSAPTRPGHAARSPAPLPMTGTTTQTALSTNCYKFTLTGTDSAGNTASISTTVKIDTTAPVSGALTVNAIASSGAGTSSYNKTGSYAFTVRTDYTDAASQIASSVLTESSATLSGNACGAYGAATVLAGNPAQSGKTTGCWKYVLTGTDNAGNTATTTTTVKVDLVRRPVAPSP